MITLKTYPQPKQKLALTASDKFPVLFYGGAKGGGKSYLVRAREMLRRMKYPGSKGLIVRKTYPELRSNHILQFFKEYPETKQWYVKSEKTIYWPNGSITELSHLANTDDVFTYQGREYDDISVDEATQHEEMVFKILRSSLRTTNPNIQPRFLLTGNPGGIGHAWVKRIFIDRQFLPEENPDDFGFVQAKLSDNAALMEADPGYKKRLEDLPIEMRRAYLEGDWDIFSGQVFNEYRRHLHVTDPTYPRAEFATYLSFDWGYAAPFACYAHTLVDMKTTDGKVFKRLITWNEWYGVEKAPAAWAKIIYDDLKQRRVTLGVCDPSMLNRKSDGSRPIMEEFTDAWRRLSDTEWGMPIDAGSRDRIKRIALTHAWLSLAPDGLPYWLIAENCQNLIRTMPMLVYDINKPEDVDTTQEDHAWDSISYLLSDIKYEPVFVGGFTNKFKEAHIIEMVDDEGRGLPTIDPHAFETSYNQLNGQPR